MLFLDFFFLVPSFSLGPCWIAFQLWVFISGAICTFLWTQHFSQRQFNPQKQVIKLEKNSILSLFLCYRSIGYAVPQLWKRFLELSFKMFSFLLKATDKQQSIFPCEGMMGDIHCNLSLLWEQHFLGGKEYFSPTILQIMIVSFYASPQKKPWKW